MDETTIQSTETTYTVSAATVQEIGRQFTDGAMARLGDTLTWICVLAVCIYFARGLLKIGMDDSDKDTWHRSDLKVLTDYKTGVQYLSDGHGGMVVRVGATGLPIINRD